MRVSFLVCFFLPFSLLNTEVADAFENLSNLEQQVQTCTIQEASDLSKKLSMLYQDVQDHKKHLHKQEQVLKKEYQGLLDKQTKKETNYLQYKRHLEIDLLLQQHNYPILDLSLKDKIKELEDLVVSKKKIDEQVDNRKKTLEEIHQRSVILSEAEGRIQKAQDTLFVRFSRSNWPKTQQEETYDVSKVIQGTSNLPVFGGMEGNDMEDSFSCLEADASIQETSLFFDSIIQDAYISAGTWSYPQGGLHLGMDLASDMYSEIYAPANGIILYADAPCASDGGYLENWEGWPYGGGNTICMIVSVQDQLYGLSLAHLSNAIYVRAGQQISQGDLIALSGNSGNSTGPHTHVEVFEIHTSLEDVITYFMQNADFSFGCGWQEPATTSAYATRIAPESVLT